MSPFVMFVTLTAIAGPTLTYVSPPQNYTSATACDRARPQMERVVARLIEFNPASLNLVGTMIGEPSRAYFVSNSRCLSAEETSIP